VVQELGLEELMELGRTWTLLAEVPEEDMEGLGIPPGSDDAVAFKAFAIDVAKK